MAASVQTPAPPDPPELPEGSETAPAWPWWFAVLGFAVGLFATFFLVGIVGGALTLATGADTDGPAFVVVGTVMQGIAFGATALFFASRVRRPRAWHFGLRATPFWSTVGWAALGILVFYVLTAVYGVLVKTDAEQDTVQQLGGDDGGFGLVVAGVMVVMVAPVVEEFFFRGFFYKALRSRFHWVLAALIDGVLFGAIHFSGNGVDGLLILPPLMILGVIFCLVYEKTGSLMAPIGMHAFNNAVAFGVQADDGWKVSVVAGPLLLVLLVVVSKWVLPDAPRGGPGPSRATVAHA